LRKRPFSGKGKIPGIATYKEYVVATIVNYANVRKVPIRPKSPKWFSQHAVSLPICVQLQDAHSSALQSATCMNLTLRTLAIAAVLLATPHLHAQAADIPSAATPSDGLPGQTPEQHGKALLDKMVAALGGDAWLNRTSLQLDGRTAAFFQGAPDPGVTEYHEARRLFASGQPEASRIGFLTDRGMIMPGKKIDVSQIWTGGQGYEITYKGQTTLPKDQVADYYRRRAHSIEEVIHSWIHAPGVMIVAEGTAMVERRQVDKVTVLSDNNDAVTLFLDATTHLPLRRTFEWRNEQFKDLDEDAEEYDDYHDVQGLPTAMTITRYHNGDMVSQRFYTKVTYNVPLAPSLFDPAVLPAKKK
jgi:hypothetical protein